jgi:dTDP-4-dehydrorhamnose 3,5-epimerase
MVDGQVAGVVLSEQPDLLEQTLGAAIRDAQTVTPAGVPIAGLLDGMSRFRRPTHLDDRGWLVEMWDDRWEFSRDPVRHVYTFTIRPGVAKGWAIHRRTEDRYFMLLGHAELVLFDVRPESATRGQVAVIRMSEFDRGLVNIPPYVWHATRNIGATDVVAVNFKATPYDHESPDKYRLPLDTPLIPYSFGNAQGW